MTKIFRIMRRSLMLIVITLAHFITINAQNQQDPVLLEINGEKVTESEFITLYEKNNQQHTAVDTKTIEEYLDLYINFRLKVKEAESLGMDTAQAFIDELQQYREQLAEPYLTDTKVTDELIEEAYERMKYDIRASHIVLTLPPDATPEDTLDIYNELIEIRNRVIQGEDFGKLAQEYSDDPSARNRLAGDNQTIIKGDQGDLGYFTVFNMIYPFENVAYNTEPGEISMPVRSKFGYHIIKVTDKLPSPGQIRIAHIMVEKSPGSSDEEKQKAEERINKLYQKIINGTTFNQVAANHSDDKASAARGGLLPFTNTNRMPPEFVVTLNKLREPGNFSKPFKTQFGWHIVKLLDKRPIKPLDEMYHELEKRIQNDERSRLSQKYFVNKLKKEYEFEENPNALNVFYEIVDNSVFEESWETPSDKELNEELFSFADRTYTQQDFADYVIKTQTKRRPEPVLTYINQKYEEFISNRIINFENSRLEEKHPEFNKLMKEYRDGILLFELTNEMVWSKAMKDTAELKEFYNNNIDNYLADKRIDATIYTCQNRRTARRVRRQLRRADENENLHKIIPENINTDSRKVVEAEKDVFDVSHNEIFKNISLKKGISDNISNNDKISVVHIHEVIEPQPQPLNKIRGKVIADYQNHLEKEWIEQLREKYHVEVNDKVLSRIINK